MYFVQYKVLLKLQMNDLQNMYLEKQEEYYFSRQWYLLLKVFSSNSTAMNFTGLLKDFNFKLKNCLKPQERQQ